MKVRPGPIVALGLLLALGAWTYFAEFRGASQKRKAEEGKDRVLAFARADVKGLGLTNANGTFRIEKRGESWALTAPLAAEADKEAVEGILNTLDIARVERRLGADASPKEYGLDPPKARLEVDSGAGGTPPAVGVGDANPIGGTYYALLPEGGVAVVGSGLGDLVTRDLLSLRDKALLSFDPWKIRRLRIERGRERVVLSKPNDAWKLEEPVEAPADGTAVSDLLSAVERLRATAFPSEAPKARDLRRFGLAPAAARLTLLQEGWDVEKTILFGREADGGRYARTEGRAPVLSVPGDVWSKITTRVFDLRRKEMLGVNQYRVESVRAARPKGPAIALARQKDQSWTLSGPVTGPIKADSADALLRMVSDLKAVAFRDNTGEAERLALARRPRLDLTLTEEADAAGGEPKSQHLVIGAPDRAGRVPVRDMAWRPIGLVPDGVLAKINDQLDALVTEATEAAKAAASPSPGPSPSPSPGAAASPTPAAD